MKRKYANRNARLKADPASALRKRLRKLATDLIQGKQMTSPMFLQRTSFQTEDSFREHMKEEAEKLGCCRADYGDYLCISHRVPPGEYDFNDPLDVKHCWSTANVHALRPDESCSKQGKLIFSWIREVDPSFWPSSWQGKTPQRVVMWQ